MEIKYFKNVLLVNRISQPLFWLKLPIQTIQKVEFYLGQNKHFRKTEMPFKIFKNLKNLHVLTLLKQKLFLHF